MLYICPGWCDYIITDSISSPPKTAASERWLARRLNASAQLQPQEMEGIDEDMLKDIDPESSAEDWM
jgi:hypothetical protein